MRHRLIVLAALATLAGSVDVVRSAFTSKARATANVFEAAAVFPPRLVTPPAVSGTAKEGETLTATTGSWARGTTSTAIQWLRCDAGGDACTATSTGATRELTAADVGKTMRVEVTATNAGGSTTTRSTQTAVVVAAPPVNTMPPVVTGTTTVGEILTATEGVWTRPTQTPTYGWLRCTPGCVRIDGETTRTFLLTGADAGATIKAEVTHGTVSATSAASGTIARATYTHVLCANPATGAGVGTDGVLPDGWTHVDTMPAITTSPAAATRCSGPGAAGIPLGTSGTYTTSVVDERLSLLYRTPAGVDLVRAELFRHGTMSGRWSWAIQHTSATNLFSPRVELCSWGDGCLTRGSSTPRFGAQNKVTIPFSATNGFNVTIACDIGAGSSCTADGTQIVRIYGGTATLVDESTPNATAVGGGLTSGDTIDPTETLDVSATDDGAGLHRVRVLIDDTTVTTRAIHDNGGRCLPGDAPQFAFQRPCVASATAALTFDTTTWPRGSHRLRVLLEDAGRNSLTVVDRRVSLP